MEDAPTATSCYRHPARPTAIRCQRCSRSICRDCMIAAPVGFHCPECVTSAAKQTRQVSLVQGSVPYLTYGFIGINVFVAVAGMLTTPGWFQGQLGTFGVNAGLLGGGVTLKSGVPTLIGVDAGE